jgi:methylated-DNA-[protein]-cysteine S-methyltransferase
MHTNWGTIRVQARDGRITACRLPVLDNQPEEPVILDHADLQASSQINRQVLGQARDFIRKSFAGKSSGRPILEIPPASPFTQRVWEAIREIPLGRVMTYGALAQAVGHPGAARAAGRACGANLLPLFIPCHRIVAAGGGLGGFSSGTAWKKTLLYAEQSLPGHPG